MRPRSRPWTCWRDYISHLAWERLWGLPEELESVAGYCDLALDKWKKMDGLMDVLNMMTLFNIAQICPITSGTLKCYNGRFELLHGSVNVAVHTLNLSCTVSVRAIPSKLWQHLAVILVLNKMHLLTPHLRSLLLKTGALKLVTVEDATRIQSSTV